MSKKLIAACITLLAVLIYNPATSQISMPAPSPAGSVSTVVGLTEVSIDYFRPSVKGRKIFGEGTDYLQPYGQLWRTGANTGTVLNFSTDVKLGGQDVPAGEYLVFTVPGASDWKFMLYSDISLGGNTAGYDKTKEVLNISAKPEKLVNTVETLTFQVTDLKADNSGAHISMSWADVQISIPVEVDFDAIVLADIKEKTSGSDVNPNVYMQAATYYLETDRELDQALEWANKGIEANPNAFWNIHTKAKIQAKLGNKKDAIKTAEESIAKAKASGNDFGYVKLNEDLIASLK